MPRGLPSLMKVLIVMRDHVIDRIANHVAAVRSIADADGPGDGFQRYLWPPFSAAVISL